MHILRNQLLPPPSPRNYDNHDTGPPSPLNDYIIYELRLQRLTSIMLPKLQENLIKRVVLAKNFEISYIEIFI